MYESTGESLGEGAFGRVKTFRNIAKNQEFAVKVNALINLILIFMFCIILSLHCLFKLRTVLCKYYFFKFWGDNSSSLNVKLVFGFLGD